MFIINNLIFFTICHLKKKWVSVAADTLNFICYMKEACIGILIGLGITLVFIVVIYLLSVCSYFGSIKAITSSPVEEMYHRQLVTTIDSILDARFSDGCCEKDIDNDNTYTMKAGFNRKFMPME